MTFAVCEIKDDGSIEILSKKYDMLSDLSKSAIESDFYPSVFVARDDLYSAICRQNPDMAESCRADYKRTLKTLYDRIKKIDEPTMVRLAEKLQDHLVENGDYWGFLQGWLEQNHIGLPEDIECD
jgi:hypothetical protein